MIGYKIAHPLLLESKAPVKRNQKSSKLNKAFFAANLNFSQLIEQYIWFERDKANHGDTETLRNN